jgi:response regulator RpfG family c-di-GMP phosphodiesterase
VRRYLRERAGKDFDPAVVDIFLKTVADGAVEPNELVEK